MPRRPRLRLADIPFHVIQRGNNRARCFRSSADYRRYLRYLREESRAREVAIHAYVLMTNHVHLLVSSQHPDGVSQLMKFLGQRYVQYFNRKYERSGSLWEGRFRSCLVDTDSYLITCHRYIEANPVRAGMVQHPAKYPWSSYGANALGKADAVVTPHPAMEGLGPTPADRLVAYRGLFDTVLEPRLVEEIRRTTNAGYVLGRARFRADVAQVLGRRVERGTAGRPTGAGNHLTSQD
jgi:putative transposase